MAEMRKNSVENGSAHSNQGSGLGGARLRVNTFLRDRLSQWLGYTHGGKRDLYTVFGWERDLTIEGFVAMYRRNPIAFRVVNAFPEATWTENPTIRDEAGSSPDETSDEYSEFCKSIDDMFSQRTVSRVLERADRMSGQGRFSIIVVGLRDGKELHEPLELPKDEGAVKKLDLLYLQPYGEPNVVVSDYDRDPHSERFGLPLFYTVNQSSSTILSAGMPTLSFRVHQSRVIHIAERIEDSTVMGIPRLMPVFNHLTDLEKTIGASAETFWICANRGMAVWADKDANLDEDAIQAVKDQMEDFTNQLRRTVVGSGMTAQVLGSDSPDPEPLVDKILQMISGGSGVPMRIMTGSESGHKASTQDEGNWAKRIDERRENFATPSVLTPLVDLMIKTGNVIKPKGKWWVEWKTAGELGPEAQANVDKTKTDALVAYAGSSMAQIIVPPHQYVTEILHMTPVDNLDQSLQDAQVEEQDREMAMAVKAAPGDKPGERGKPVDKSTGKAEGKDALPVVNMELKPAYVMRKVRNARQIAAWATKAGFQDKLPADDLHVTICYSKKSFDWKAAGVAYTEEDDGSILIPAGGPRQVGLFNGVFVLEFTNRELEARNRRLLDCGAVSDYDEYKPHVSFANATHAMPRNMEMYNGPISLGPEEWMDLTEVA